MTHSNIDYNIYTACFGEAHFKNFAESVENLEKQNEDVKKAGVFKICCDEQSADQTSSLQELLQLLRVDIIKPKVQYVMKFGANPSVYGHINAHSSTKQQISFKKILNDESAFLSTSLTCCTTILERDGPDALLAHFYCDFLKRNSTFIYGYKKPESLNIWRKKGKKLLKKVEKLRKEKESIREWETKPIYGQKKTPHGCNCVDCYCEPQDTDSEDKTDQFKRNSNKGVMYASGVSSPNHSTVKITNTFSLSQVTNNSMLIVLADNYEGFTEPMFYVASAHSFFPIHIEDVSMYSINFLFYGAPKLWIVVPPSSVRKLDYALSKCNVNVSHTSCRNLLLHKYHVVTPEWLQHNNIPFKAVIQRAGEAVVVCPNAAHVGFNLGPNIAQALNFVTKTWAPYGMVSPKCKCRGDEVHIDLRPILATFLPELLESFINQRIPKVEDDPLFQQSVLIDWATALTLQPLSDNGEKQLNLDLGIDEVSERNSLDKVVAVTKRRHRKTLCCPADGCTASYKEGKKQRLIRHVNIQHAFDSSKDELKRKLKEMFPERTKIAKQVCPICGALIAGRANQMKDHQSRGNCKKKEELSEKEGLNAKTN